MQAEHELTSTASYIVRTIAALPPLPSAAQEIIEQFGDEFIDANAVTRVVERDPGICGKLLGLANSAYFNLPEPVASMKEAISRVLGVDTVRSLVFAMALQQSFNGRKCPSFDSRRFWLDSLCVAEGCKKLARNGKGVPESVRNLAYPTGLCHNLGLLALTHIRPEQTDTVLRRHAEQPDSSRRLSALMIDEFNTDHRITTAELARVWGLPQPVVDAFRWRAGPRAADPADRLAAILEASAAAVGNVNGPEEARLELDESASRLGLTVEQLEQIAEPGEKQKERLRSIAHSMQG